MKVFITGATGFIGANLALRLADSGVDVHALYRNKARTEGIVHDRIRWFKGDLMNRESLKNAMGGCTRAYHLGAYATLLVKNPEILYEQNVQGTVNLLECAKETGLQRVVFTSTAGVVGPTEDGPRDETSPYPRNIFTHYIQSKILAEKKILEYVRKGMDIVIVNPSRVFGPGMMSMSNSARILDLYLRRKLYIIPGRGIGTGNYVFVDDVSEGIILAMEKGRTGERYLLGGEDITYDEYIDAINRILGKRKFQIKIPVKAIYGMAYVFLFLARFSGWTPPFTPREVLRISDNWRISSEKAKAELGYNPRSFEEGMKITFEWLKNLHTPSSRAGAAV